MADQTSSPFLLLPDDLISKIIRLTSPKDACRATVVSPAFKFVADSDIVWEYFLSPEYGEITSPVTFSSMKELYFQLCDSHHLLREGKMSIKLNKYGKKAYMVAARELDIAWIDTPTQWRWKSYPESRFGEVAELLNARWIDIRATMQSGTLSPNTNYVGYFVFKLSEDHYGLQCPSVATVTFRCQTQADDEITNKTMFSIGPLRIPFMNAIHRFPNVLDASRRRGDGWMELCLGEFYVEGGNVHYDVRIQVYKTENLPWKKGLIVEGIEVRPKAQLRSLMFG